MAQPDPAESLPRIESPTTPEVDLDYSFGKDGFGPTGTITISNTDTYEFHFWHQNWPTLKDPKKVISIRKILKPKKPEKGEEAEKGEEPVAPEPVPTEYDKPSYLVRAFESLFIEYATSYNDPLPAIGRGDYLNRNWNVWTKYDFIDWIRVHMETNCDVMTLWKHGADGPMLQKIIDYDMEKCREEEFPETDNFYPLRPPIPELSPYCYNAISTALWNLALDPIRQAHKEYMM